MGRVAGANRLAGWRPECSSGSGTLHNSSAPGRSRPPWCEPAVRRSPRGLRCSHRGVREVHSRPPPTGARIRARRGRRRSVALVRPQCPVRRFSSARAGATSPHPNLSRSCATLLAGIRKSIRFLWRANGVKQTATRRRRVRCSDASHRGCARTTLPVLEVQPERLRQHLRRPHEVQRDRQPHLLQRLEAVPSARGLHHLQAGTMPLLRRAPERRPGRPPESMNLFEARGRSGLTPASAPAITRARRRRR